MLTQNEWGIAWGLTAVACRVITAYYTYYYAELGRRSSPKNTPPAQVAFLRTLVFLVLSLVAAVAGALWPLTCVVFLANLVRARREEATENRKRAPNTSH